MQVILPGGLNKGLLSICQVHCNGCHNITLPKQLMTHFTGEIEDGEWREEDDGWIDRWLKVELFNACGWTNTWYQTGGL